MSLAMMIIWGNQSDLLAQFDVQRFYLTADQGLSQNVVTSLWQDSRGYLWIGTRDGLNRFDGFQTKNYWSLAYDSTTISASEITRIFESKDQSLWIGSMAGLSLYNRVSKDFSRIYLQTNSETQPQIHDIFETRQGRLYLSTSNGVYVRSGSQKTFKQHSEWHSEENGLNPPGRFFSTNLALYLTTNENEWFRYNGDLNQWMPLKLGITNDSHLFSTTQLNDSTFLVADHEYLYVVNPDREEVELLPEAPLKVTTLQKLNEGILFAGRDMEIYFSPLDAIGQEWEQLNEEYEDISRVSTPRIIISTTGDAVWIGTNGFGLIKLIPKTQSFQLLKYDDNLSNSLYNRSIRSLLPLNDSILFIGGYSGFEKFNSKQNQFQIIFSEQKKALKNDKGLYVTPVPYTMIKDQFRKNIIWMGTEGEGLVSYDYVKDEFKQYNLDGDFFQNFVVQLAQLSKDRLLIVCQDGVRIFDLGTEQFTHELTEIKGQLIMPFSLKKIGENRFLVGLKNGTLLNLDSENWGWEATEIFSNPNRTDRAILSICKTKDETVWLGTQSGLIQLDNEFQPIVDYSIKDGLPNNTIYSVQEGRTGDLWMSSNRGISRFRINLQEFQNFTLSDGLQSLEFNRNAYASLRDSILYFGGVQGVNLINTETFTKENKSHSVFVERIVTRDDDWSIDIYGKSDQIFKFQESKEHQIRIYFTTPILENTGDSKYYYKIQGNKAQWTPVPGNANELVLQNLNDGEYELQIVRSSNGRVSDAGITSFIISIIPPIYERFSFQFMVAILIFGAGWLAYTRKMQAIVREKNLAQRYSKKLLNVYDEERHRIARALHDSVGIDLMMAKMSIQKLNREGEIEQISKSVHTLEHTISQIRSISHNLHPHLLANIGLEKTLKNLLQKLSETAPFRLKYSVDLSEDLLDTSKELHLYRFIQECLNNAVKHSKADLCVVSISKKNGAVEVEITDDGVGFDLSSEKEKQFGLVSLRERAELIDAELTIKSAPNQGTRIHLNISLDS